MVHIKVCGLTTLAAAQTAIDAGADYIGFIFAESKRKMTPEQVREITSKLKGEVKKVGVFVNETAEEINRIVHFSGLDMIQLHGEESPEFAANMPMPVIKVVTVHSPEDLEKLSDFKTDYLLLDLPKNNGDSHAKTLDWEFLRDNLHDSSALFLAGGLTPENVGKAIRVLRPFAVDVSSGVETSGKKDHGKIKAFIKNIKQEEGEPK